MEVSSGNVNATAETLALFPPLVSIAGIQPAADALPKRTNAVQSLFQRARPLLTVSIKTIEMARKSIIENSCYLAKNLERLLPKTASIANKSQIKQPENHTSTEYICTTA